MIRRPALLIVLLGLLWSGPARAVALTDAEIDELISHGGCDAAIDSLRVRAAAGEVLRQYQLGWCQEMLGDWEAARLALEPLAQRPNPWRASSRYRLALMALSLDRPEEAVSWLAGLTPPGGRSDRIAVRVARGQALARLSAPGDGTARGFTTQRARTALLPILRDATPRDGFVEAQLHVGIASILTSELLRIPWSQSASAATRALRAKLDRLGEVERRLSLAVSTGDPIWVPAAALMMAEACWQLRDQVRAAPVPAGIRSSEELTAHYLEQLEDGLAPLDAIALRALQEGELAVQRLRAQGPWVDRLRARLDSEVNGRD